jgi:ubiquinone/menaquinone biosynthesis C-methylase UbiE
MQERRHRTQTDQVERCPWWLCFTFDNFIRRSLQNPVKILSPYVKEGYVVLDVGPGMGYATIPLARLVGKSGRVIALDIQPHMLVAIYRRAQRAGLQDRISLKLSKPDDIGVNVPVDVCLAFWMLHEVGNRKQFINQIAEVLKPGGKLFIVEPKLHVSYSNFTESLSFAQESGLEIVARPNIFISNAAVLEKKVKVLTEH